MPPTDTGTALAERSADARPAPNEEDPAHMTSTPGPVPDTAAVEAALRLLDFDPASIAAGQPGPHRRAALLAHLAALATRHADTAEHHADLPADVLRDLHWRADVATANNPGAAAQYLLAQQTLRARRARDIIHTMRGDTQHPIADACLASLDAVTDLLDAWHDATPHQATPDSPITGEEIKVAPLLDAMHRLAYAHHVLHVTTSQTGR